MFPRFPAGSAYAKEKHLKIHLFPGMTLEEQLRMSRNISFILSIRSEEFELPVSKRRKFVELEATVTQIGTEIRSNGTMTPVELIFADENDNMDTEITQEECPCGYLHGPGFGHCHDISAVGFSPNIMRGPE